MDFIATSISEHTDSNLFNISNQKLLKSILLYGHNASGKSKIIKGLDFFVSFILNSATEKNSTDPINVTPFLLNSETEDKPSFFEMNFIIDKSRYRYGFEVDRKEVHKEWLLESKAQKEYPVFLRIKQEFEISDSRFENAADLDKRTRKDALFLSVAAQWNVSKAQMLIEWFSKILVINGIEDKKYRQLTIDLYNSEKNKALLSLFLQKADLSISDMDIYEVPLNFDELFKDLSDPIFEKVKEKYKKDSYKAVVTLHRRFDKNNQFVGIVPFLLDSVESEGTIKYFNLIGLIVTSILEGRFIVIDELDGRFHTLLSKAILKLFNSSKIKSKSQLLAASHDTALLDKELLRRDQIYFIEKDNFGASKATSLVEYKPRKESPYDKNYLEGKYGAIPFLGDIEKILSNVSN